MRLPGPRDWLARRAGSAGAIAGPVVGVLAALSFYALVSSMGYIAMLPAWMLFWILFALLQQRLSKDGTAQQTALRGVGAAVLSGLAFYLISGIWTKHGPPDYAVNLAHPGCSRSCRDFSCSSCPHPIADVC